MHDDTTALLRELVAIDSVNPSLVPGGAGEHAIAHHLAARLTRQGFDVELVSVGPGRVNLTAIADGRAAGPTRLLCGHTDTVGVEGMEAPFDPVIRDGCLHGRGAQDMKGGLAAMICAAEAWLAGGRHGAGRVVLAAVADEEYASLGAEALLAGLCADAAVVPEPTDLAIGVAHKGFSCAELTVFGRAAHGSRPRDGQDAILRMGRLLVRLEALDARLQAATPHPWLGTGSLHASAIVGGGSLSTYPDRCTLQMERRTLPGEPDDVAVQELRQLLDDLRKDGSGLAAEVRPLIARPAYALDTDAPTVRELRAALSRAGQVPAVTGVSFWTDAAILGAGGVPAVLYGPAGAGLHAPNEHVVLASVAACRDGLRAWLDAPSS